MPAGYGEAYFPVNISLKCENFKNDYLPEAVQ